MLIAVVIVAALIAIGLISNQSKSDNEDAPKKGDVAAMLKKMEREIQALNGDIPSQISVRKRWCDELELPDIVVRIHNSIQHYPSWVENGPEHVCPEVKNPVYLSADQNSLSFEYAGRPLGMKFKSNVFSLPDNELADHATLKLFTNDGGKKNYVLIVNAARNPDKEWDEYRAFGIESFIPGDWIQTLIDLDKRLIEFEEKRRLDEELNPAKLDADRKKFGL